MAFNDFLVNAANETEAARAKFYKEQPEYPEWEAGQPGRILGLARQGVPKAEVLRMYMEASAPDSEWNQLNAEFERRFAESGLVKPFSIVQIC